MPTAREIVITGTGMVSPIGTGREAFWNSLCTGRSGVRNLPKLANTPFPVKFGADVPDFDGKLYVKPRKSLKVMCREIQLGFAAAELALADAQLADGTVDPDRYGVVYGSDMLYNELTEFEDVYRRCMDQGEFRHERWGEHILNDLYPLWLLKYLPNMVACHVGIPHDARGPSNSFVSGEVSSLLAVQECARIIERGAADAMIAGGTGTRLEITPLMYRQDVLVSHRHGAPEQASRPFDLHRDGMALGEGSGALVLETAELAKQRHRTPLARVRGWSSVFGGAHAPGYEHAIRNSIELALRSAGARPGEITHVSAHGISTPEHDAAEARAIRAVLGEVPVFAPKSYFGNLGAGGGLVELAASVLALAHGEVPRTLNYETPDPDCPVRVTREPLKLGGPAAALVLSQSFSGQAVAVVIDNAV